MPTRPPTRDLSAGQRLGSLRLVRPLGRGGFAPVWLAEETFGDRVLRRVAVKVFFLPEGMPPSSPEADRWADAVAEEAGALCRVEHPNVVRFYSLQRDEPAGLLGLTMEYVPGASLESALLEQGRLALEAVLGAGLDMAWALAAVHDAGLVHRDVKPANVVRGAAGHKLIDFGIFAPIRKARAGAGADADAVAGADPGADPGATRPEDPDADGPVGTPGYIAPECLRPGARATPASDLYALGVTLLRLLTGRRPSGWGPGSVTIELQSADVQAPPPLRDLLRWLLQPDPTARPPHADQVAQRLERLLRGVRSGPGGAAPPRNPGDRAFAVADDLQTIRHGSTPPPAAEAAPETWPALNAHPPLIGRQEVLTSLREAAAGARAGKVHCVILTGPMGIGRTRLLEAGLAELGLGAARTLSARCAPEQRAPLRPLVDALQAALDTFAGDEQARRDLGVLVDALEEALLAKGKAALPDLEVALLHASRESPLALAIDDLQWADASTLELLRSLAGRAGDRGKLLILGTARDEPRPTSALGALLARAGGSAQPELRRVRLKPLSLPEAAQVAQAVGPCTEELAAAAARGSGGVPALLVHALVTWRATQAITWRDGLWSAVDPGAPALDAPEFGDLLRARLAEWTEAGSVDEDAALRALACVALYGGGLEEAVVLRVITADKESRSSGAGGILDALVEAGLLLRGVERRELRFAQEMMRQAALNLTRHRPWFDEVHRSLLDTLAPRRTTKVDAAFLAAGYERLGDAKRAQRWLRRAMNEAAAAGLFEDAAALGDRLAARIRDEHERTHVELRIVRAAIRGRAFEAARERLEAIERRADAADAPRSMRGATERRQSVRRRADVMRRILRLELAHGLGERGVGDETLLRDAEALRRPGLVCQALLALAGVAPAEEALRLATRAIAEARLVNESRELAARVRRLEISREANRNDRAQAEEDFRRAFEIAQRQGSAWDRIHSEADLAIREADRGQEDAAIERLRRLCGEAERQKMRGQLRLMLHNLAALLMRTGRYAEASDTARKAEDAGDPALAARARSLRAEALLRLGEAKAALALADDAARVQEESGVPQLSLTLLRRADIKQALGRGEEALADARRAREAAGARGQIDLGLSARLWEALWLARNGRAGPEVVASALEGARNASVVLQPLTRRLMEEARTLLASEEREG